MSLLNPRKMIDLGVVQGLVSDKQLQPNAIEAEVSELFQVSGSIELSEAGKKMPTLTKVEAVDGFWDLEPNSVYDCSSRLYCEIPEGIAATLNIRSTLNRGGIRLSSGVYDSGYSGHVGFIIHTGPLPLRLGVGTRVVQVMFWQSDSDGKYLGGYNHAEGKHWTEGK